MKVTCPKCHKEFETSEDKPTSAKCPHCNATLAFKYSENEADETEEEPEKVPLKVKAKNFWNTHKVKIIVGATTIVGTIATVIIYKKHKAAKESSDDLIDSLTAFDSHAVVPSDSFSENTSEKCLNASSPLMHQECDLSFNEPSDAEETCLPNACPTPETTSEDVSYQRTDIELSLLRRLAAGEFDGYEGSYWWPNSHLLVYH